MSRRTRPPPTEWARHERAYLAATGSNMRGPRTELWDLAPRKIARLAGELLQGLCELPVADAYDVLIAAYEDLDRRRRAREASGAPPLSQPGRLPYSDEPAAPPIHRLDPLEPRRVAVWFNQRPQRTKPKWKPAAGDTVVIKKSGRKAKVEAFEGKRVVVRTWVGGGSSRPRPSRRTTKLRTSQIKPTP